MRIHRNLPERYRDSETSVTSPEPPEDYHSIEENSEDYYSPKPEPIRKKRKYTKRKNMHPLESGGVGVPAFLAKLWRLVEDPETNNLISWSQVSIKIH